MALPRVFVGTWELSWETPRGAQTVGFTFAQEGTTLTGSVVMRMGPPVGGGQERTVEISNGMVEGEPVSFDPVLEGGERSFTISFAGTVTGGEMEGTVTNPRGGENPFTGKRRYEQLGPGFPSAGSRLTVAGPVRRPGRSLDPSRERPVLTSSPFGPLGSDAELKRFHELSTRLPDISRAYRRREAVHTSVVVPSISVDQGELAKIEGSAFYEERLLFTLIRLTNPLSRLIYVTSQPVHREILEYYLQHLPGVPLSRARERLLVVCLYDASPKPLTQKILERPRVMERMRRWIGDPGRAYLTCYNSTPLERRLSVELGIPLNAVDPDLLWMGTKSGSRKVFEEAGVAFPCGANDVKSRRDVVIALERLTRDRPGIRRAVVKLNESFAGEGNGVYTFPESLPEDGPERLEAISMAMQDMRWPSGRSTLAGFLRKLDEMGGIVEEWVVADEVESPSVQLRIYPGGELQVVSTHDQVLGGSTGQVYLGCSFPAEESYRPAIHDAGLRIGQVLVRHGALGRFGVDFVVTRSRGDLWKAHAIEINLRMGGTTPPFMALEFLGGGRLDPDTGLYVAADGRPKFYYASDNLKSPDYRGLLPEDLLDLMLEYGIHFKHLGLNGVLFFMIGALSQYGKLGVTAIGNSHDEAKDLYDRTVDILDRATGATSETQGAPHSLFEPDAPTTLV